MVVTLVSQELLVVSGTSWLVSVVLISGVATVLGLPRWQCVCQGCALTVISYRTARRRTVHKMPQRRGRRQVWAAEDQHAPLPPCPLTPDSASVSKHSSRRSTTDTAGNNVSAKLNISLGMKPLVIFSFPVVSLTLSLDIWLILPLLTPLI